MPKRAADQPGEGSPYAKAPSGAARREAPDNEEMGEFEDAWEDEIESDEDAVDGGEDGMDVDEVTPAIEDSEERPADEDGQVFLPGQRELEADEVLEADDSVYEMRHNLNVGWPCLSFDVLRDNLGENRRRYPATAYIVAGTQADVAKNNEITVYKLGALHRTQKDPDASDSDNEDDDDAVDEDPVVETRSIPHLGGINRIRAAPVPAGEGLPPITSPYYVAAWGETGKVAIHDVRPLIEALDVPGYVLDKARTNAPAFTINSHGRSEGFAMDWAASGPNAMRLLTGDIASKIFLTTVGPTGFNALAQPFTSHTSSVEDLQWSPSEATVFGSCSADRSVQIWDVRMKGRRSVAGVQNAHEGDVNVISWNRNTSYLLLSGGDEGGIKVWDLRNIKKHGSDVADSSPVASFAWHRGPITSIEWHPTDDSVFAATGADEQTTLWDLSVEQDDEEGGAGLQGGAERAVPPQLLFAHQGQRDVKEVHWHPQLPGTVITTALDGFNVFKTISV